MKSLNNCFSKLSVLILISSFIFGSCGKIDDTYREFLEGGATVYVAKADSLKIRPGRERVELQWLVMSDPKVKKYKVFWNNKADSIEQDLNREVNGDTVRLVIDNLAGGVYEFEVFQYSSDNKSSVRAAVIGRVYDSGYEAYLPNRSINLTVETRIANSRFFGGDIQAVPRQAVTVGVATVCDAKQVVILATGYAKAAAIRQTIEGEVSHVCTASALQLHPDAIIVCDEQSCEQLKVGTYRYFKEIEG